MKKIVISLCFSLILSAMSLIAFAQNQTQGAGEPEGLGIDIYITSAESGCPTTGIVEGTIVGGGGNWWPAIPENYTGPSYYYLFVPNAWAWFGQAHGGATTDTQYIPSGIKWCVGSGSEPFNFPIGDDMDPIYFNMSLEYLPKCED